MAKSLAKNNVLVMRVHCIVLLSLFSGGVWATKVKCWWRENNNRYKFYKRGILTLSGVVTLSKLFLYLLKRGFSKRKEFALLLKWDLWRGADSSLLVQSSLQFLISAQNIDCWYSLELSWWGSSNKYPQSMFWAEIRKIIYIPVNPSFTI